MKTPARRRTLLPATRASTLGRRCGTVGLTLLAIACGSAVERGGPASALSTTVDTVGDTTVVRVAGDVPADAEWRLVEEWRVGDEDPEIGFGRIGATAVDDDGRVFVFDPSGPLLRVLDRTGRPRPPIGRRGQGPGEYVYANGLAVLADSHVVLWDMRGARVNRYDADGTFRGIARVPFGNYSSLDNALLAHPDSGYWLTGFVVDETSRDAIIGRLAWFRYVGDSLRDTVLGPPPQAGGPALVAEGENGGRTGMLVPYFPAPSATLTADGTVWEYGGVGYRLEGRRAGRVVRIERSVSRLPVPASEREERRAATTHRLRQVQPDWRWSGPEIPAEKAPVVRIVPASDGRLLVRVPTRSEPFTPEPVTGDGGGEDPPPVRWRAPRAYEVFTADGRFDGRFTLPVGARLRALDGPRVWYRAEDGVGVPYLVQARLEDPGEDAETGG